jgi:hypothetical protein
LRLRLSHRVATVEIVRGWLALYREGDDGRTLLLGASDNPRALRAAARELLLDQPPPHDDLDRARYAVLRVLARSESTTGSFDDGG